MTRAIVEAYPDVAEGDLWSRCRINGGMICTPCVGGQYYNCVGERARCSLDYRAPDIGPAVAIDVQP